MQQPQRSWLKRLFFPFSGEKIIGGRETLRLALCWGGLFGILLALGTLPVSILTNNNGPSDRIIWIALATFVFGLIILGGTACFVVYINNQANRLLQERRAKAGQQPSGGR